MLSNALPLLALLDIGLERAVRREVSSFLSLGQHPLLFDPSLVQLVEPVSWALLARERRKDVFDRATPSHLNLAFGGHHFTRSREVVLCHGITRDLQKLSLLVFELVRCV